MVSIPAPGSATVLKLVYLELSTEIMRRLISGFVKVEGHC